MNHWMYIWKLKNINTALKYLMGFIESGLYHEEVCSEDKTDESK